MPAAAKETSANDRFNERPARTGGRIGIVDIGSNTVRMVVYDAPARLPVPIFNERVSCQLGKGIGKSGKLNPDGVKLAFKTLGRFTALAKQMPVERFKMVATAAVRDASDGPEFAKEIQRRFGFPVEVLSGEEEARLGAMGILGGVKDADGLFGDLGGGSLDLVLLENGQFKKSATVPLGHLRLAEDSGGSMNAAQKIADKAFAEIDWLRDAAGHNFYAVGGACRSLARIYVEQTDYPLHVLDYLTIPTKPALDLTKLIAGQSPASLERMSSVARRRADTLPFASLAINRLLEITKAKSLVFSGFGLREGLFFEQLPANLRRGDPLVSVCEGFAQRGGRFAVHGEEIYNWMIPVLSDLDEADHRLVLSAALLSDIGWTEHPDYRALHSFLRVLRLAIAGITHRERVMLAIATHVRYNGRRRQPEVQAVRPLLSDDDQQNAEVIGLALRLAHVLSGGVPDVLPKSALTLTSNRLTMKLEGGAKDLAGEGVQRIFEDLAEQLGVKGDIL
ncbi:MAG: exopolyphosphatase [Rhodospirillales bacterium]|jgi:exopolyphosphatase/guanosine-5'-triphosphate,3'-diphosphate pyrophosphatase|nr:exopolyphosphatase [Rhodospirillales bacterium]